MAAAPIQKRRLILSTTDEPQTLAETDVFVFLIKTKLFDLAVKGA